MMNCGKVRRWFGAYWDDEITQAEREWVDAHFASCERCRSEYETFARTLESLGSLPRHEVAPDFVERTLARARHATTAADRLQTPRRAWAPIAVAASLLLVAVPVLTPWIARAPQGPVARLAVPQEAKLVVREAPPPVAPVQPVPASGSVATLHASSQDRVAALVDSLIDHSEDVDFVLDPVRVSRERTAGRPVQGERAVINF